MHGFIFIEFEKFVLGQIDFKVWRQTLQSKNIDSSMFSPTDLYEDSKLVEMLLLAADVCKKSPEFMLEGFGAFMVPDLLKVYRAYIDPAWKTLELLEHAENTIHVAVRKSTAGAAPPILQVERLNQREVLITYVSARNMPELGVGIIKGLGAFFNENLEVTLDKRPAEGCSLILVRIMQ